MPPCIVDAKTVEGKKANNALQLNNLKKAIPEEAFAKSLPKSLGYMIFDYVMIAASFYGFYTLNNSAVWQTMPLWQQAIANVVYWNITGFFMWCTFMVGHDCGHTTFSDYEIVNDIAGHIAHGFLMVPYYPWQVRLLLTSLFPILVLSFVLFFTSCRTEDITCTTTMWRKTTLIHGIPQIDWPNQMNT